MSNPTYQHLSLASGRWFQLSLVEQLANVGSEVFRTISWRAKPAYGNPDHAFFRALELLELTKNDMRHTAAARRELCRTYECLVDWHYGSKLYGSTDTEWQNYFMAFTYAARKGR